MFTSKYLSLGYISIIAIILGLVINTTFVNTAQAADDRKIELKIKGMGCEMCAHAIDKVISSCVGVKGCDVSYKDGKATVEIEVKANIEEIKKAVGDAGFFLDEWSIEELQ